MDEKIITKEMLDQVWEIGHQRVMELERLIKEYPLLTRFIRDLKKDYIVCLNAIKIRDMETIRKRKEIIDKKEAELEKDIEKHDEDTRREKRAKQIKESEESKDGK